MDHLDLYALRRQNAFLARRLELVESFLEGTGIIEAALAGNVLDDLRSSREAAFDLGQLTRAQLETALHDITAERTRLDVFESMIHNEIKAYAPAS
jgi:hypothetical protein